MIFEINLCSLGTHCVRTQDVRVKVNRYAFGIDGPVHAGVFRICGIMFLHVLADIRHRVIDFSVFLLKYFIREDKKALRIAHHIRKLQFLSGLCVKIDAAVGVVGVDAALKGVVVVENADDCGIRAQHAALDLTGKEKISVIGPVFQKVLSRFLQLPEPFPAALIFLLIPFLHCFRKQRVFLCGFFGQGSLCIDHFRIMLVIKGTISGKGTACKEYADRFRQASCGF